MTTANPPSRSRFGLLLAAGQVRYQLLLVLRSPMGNFTTLIIPLMLLVVLNVATPQTALAQLHGVRYADFLTPAMGTFALLNACYVNVVTSVVIAREDGILKRLHGTPLPLWAYVVGRMAAAAATAAASVVIVFAVAVIFLHVHLNGHRVAALVAISALGVASFTTLGMAISTFVPRTDTALPVAYGTILPLAFLSNVFFPATTAPTWLQHLADGFPLSPIAKASERAFSNGSNAWPMTQGQLSVVLAWIGGAALVTAIGFRWQPGATLLGRWHQR